MTNKTVDVMGYPFEGPYAITTSFNQVAGVYLITNVEGKIIDVGETDDLKNRIPGHERAECWSKNLGENLWFHFESNQQRRLVKEKNIRDAHRPICGIK